MKIRSKIRRKAGTEVKFDDTTYVFNDKNDHTCEVDNTKHAKRFLAIPEGYEPADLPKDDGEEKKPAKKTAAKKQAAEKDLE